MKAIVVRHMFNDYLTLLKNDYTNVLVNQVETELEKLEKLSEIGQAFLEAIKTEQEIIETPRLLWTVDDDDLKRMLDWFRSKEVK